MELSHATPARASWQCFTRDERIKLEALVDNYRRRHGPLVAWRLPTGPWAKAFGKHPSSVRRELARGKMRSSAKGKKTTPHNVAAKRGRNEKNHTFLRRFLGYGRLAKHSQGTIQHVTNFINDYPRKRFYGKSSREVLELLLQGISPPMRPKPLKKWERKNQPTRAFHLAIYAKVSGRFGGLVVWSLGSGANRPRRAASAKRESGAPGSRAPGIPARNFEFRRGVAVFALRATGKSVRAFFGGKATLS